MDAETNRRAYEQYRQTHQKPRTKNNKKGRKQKSKDHHTPQKSITVSKHDSVVSNDLWTSHDDKLLLENIQNCPDVSILAKCVKFSHNFSCQMILSRWHAMLSDYNTQAIACERGGPLEENNLDLYLNQLRQQIQDQENESKNAKVVSSKNEVLPSIEEVAQLSRIPSTVLADHNLESTQSKTPTENRPETCRSIFGNERNFHIWSNLRWQNLLCDQKIEVTADDQLDNQIERYLGFQQGKSKSEENSLVSFFDGSKDDTIDRDDDDDRPKVKKARSDTAFKQLPKESGCSDELENEKSGHDLKSIQDADIFRNPRLAAFEEKLGAASQMLMQYENFDQMAGNSRVHRDENRERIDRYRLALPKFAFANTDCLGQLTGKFHRFNLRATSTFIFGDPLEVESEFNLNLELSYADVPKFVFKVWSQQAERESESENYSNTDTRVHLKNLTNHGSDVPVFITRDGNMECLLNAESREIEDGDMVKVYDMQFVFYRNSNFKLSQSTVSDSVQKDYENSSDLESQITVIPNHADL